MAISSLVKFASANTIAILYDERHILFPRMDQNDYRSPSSFIKIQEEINSQTHILALELEH